MTHEEPDMSMALTELQTAVDENQFRFDYQPKLDCETLGLKGFEALIRWVHPSYGVIMPNQFIPVAEELGLIGRITELIVENTFQWYKSTPGVQGLALSINFSAKRLSDASFADWLLAKCRAAGIRQDAITLEVSEVAVLQHRLHALDMFTGLRSKGFRVAIDDFGIGQSSLKLLAQLPFSEVKIDKSYAINALLSPEAKTFIKNTVATSHNIELKVAAEGIEDRETLDFVRQVGCDFVQGYFISHPIPAAETADWILNRRQKTRHILV